MGARPPLPKNPDGVKVFTVEQTGQPTVELAAKWVADNGGNTLLLTGWYFQEPNFLTGSAIGTNTIIEWNKNVNVIGRGSQWCGVALRGAVQIDASKITDTNPYTVTHCSGGADRVHSGYRVDCGNYGQMTVSFSGSRWDGMTRPVMTDKPVIRFRGLKDIPPEETHGDWYWNCVDARVRHTHINAHKVTATIWSVNKGSNHTYENCSCANSYGGHGFSSWGVDGITYVDCDSAGHGTVGSSRDGASYNHEETGPRGIVHTRTRGRAATIACGRFEAGYLLGAVELGAAKIVLTDCDWQGAPYAYSTENNQRSTPTVIRGTLAGSTGVSKYVPGNRLTWMVANLTGTGDNPPSGANGTGSRTFAANGRVYTTPGNSAVYDEWTLTAGSAAAVTAVIRTPAAKPTASVRVLDLFDTATASKLRITITSTGVMQVIDSNGAGSLYLGTVPLLWDTEYTVQFWVTNSASGTAGVVHFDYYLGDQVATPVEAGLSTTAGATGTNGFARLRVGQTIANAAVTAVTLRKLGINTNPSGYIGYWAV